MIAYRYTINDGEAGGMVFGDSIEDAKRKLINFYDQKILSNETEIWKWEDDDYYKPVPDVYECYGY